MISSKRKDTRLPVVLAGDTINANTSIEVSVLGVKKLIPLDILAAKIKPLLPA